MIRAEGPLAQQWITVWSGKWWTSGRSFRLLFFLTENRKRVVRKDELIEVVWEGHIASEATLKYAY
ncbi:MAG: winged helix-turn-helix domain-containing protein [Proteobacteria bacterium]|nr:winged helix-turn-helix domain-containing protein [Pseudomonadota bacterium]